MNKKLISIIVHSLCWILFLSLPIFFSPSFGTHSRQFPNILGYPLNFFIINSFLVPLFYLNAYVLVPRLFVENRKSWYFISIAILLTLFLALPEPNRAPFFSHNDIPEHLREELRKLLPLRPTQDKMIFSGPRMIPRIVSFCLVWLLGILLRINERWQLAEKRSKESELEKLQAELSYLKLQINPHFLFNTLNNIYSLASIQSKKTPEAVLKLSDIMRYVMQDAQADWVTVQQEIQYLRSYIELQQMRSNEKLQLVFETDIRASDKKIAPLLLISFIENAFKYGISNHEESPISIKIYEQNNKLELFVRNNIFKREAASTDAGNIGLTNTRRRLEILYPGKHALSIHNEHNVFSIHLIIELV